VILPVPDWSVEASIWPRIEKAITPFNLAARQRWEARVQCLIEAAADGPDKETSSTKMSVSDADKKAKELAGKHKAAFFALSQTQQAKLIGCHLDTWQKTPFYQAADRRGRIRKRGPAKTLPAVDLSGSILETEGYGVQGTKGQHARHDMLNQLVEGEEAEAKRQAELKALREEQRRDDEQDKKRRRRRKTL
jgi:hypothetical protein